MLELLKPKKYLGLWLAAILLIFRWVFEVFPDFCEVLYGQIFFPSMRWVLDYTLGLLPFPSFYLFFLFVVYHLIKSIQKIKEIFMRPFLKILSILNFWAWLFCAFLILWGFNYQRPEIAERLNFPEVQLKKLAYERMIRSSVQKISSIPYKEISFLPVSQEINVSELRSAQQAFLENLGYVSAGNVQMKRLKPDGIFSSFGISGMYLPWVGQGNIDNCLSNLEGPFIGAHEMAHANGITNEGEASLVAYMTCWATKNNLYRYSAEIYLLRNLLFRLKNRDQAAYLKILDSIPIKVKEDIAQIKLHRAQYPNLIPNLSDRLNNTYLKSQGIESGSKSYGELIELVYNFRNYQAQ